MLFITPAGTMVLWWLGGLCLGLVALVLFLRKRLHNAKPGSQDKRTKLAEADAFALSGPIHRLALCVAIVLSVIAINWTTFEDTTEFTLSMDAEIDPFDRIVPPTIQNPPPPPPPPPPPLIEAVEEPDVEPDTLVDNFIDVDMGVTTEPMPVVLQTPAPPPPPPPAPPTYDNAPVIFAERMPVFNMECWELSNEAERKQCSDKAILTFFSQEIKYPEMARINGIQGRAVISFTVELDGSVSDVSIMRDPGAGLGAEAARVVNLINKKTDGFRPGSQQGRKVRVRFNVPILFNLQ